MKNYRSGPKRPRGRPRLPEDELRHWRVNVMLDAREHAALEALADEQDLPVGTVARDIVLRVLRRRGLLEKRTPR